MAYVSPAIDDTSTNLDIDEKNQMGLPSGWSSAPSAASLHQRQLQSDIHSHDVTPRILQLNFFFSLLAKIRALPFPFLFPLAKP
jgi:hypothetical protein